ncbi:MULTISPECIES: substrate-binding domain-containing protein [Oleiagrimonas]|uniref:ABC transporter substrate-binding protein n=1 Tax=Oleiagrimonas citrea TaxID=1665687 RepID=A0A846ZMK9_9GAMM|nr:MULTISPECIES: substrate-binding domain-containing protein [Oleiagrimonas]NKZ39082.1 ABC transporter substrate-binding protein [Oleiagrimonas citrea]RAP57689.1 glycine/betaine ABC transporter substrate-binding protein [Oleiagrimonas sp. MCCC 1A03011]
MTSRIARRAVTLVLAVFAAAAGIAPATAAAQTAQQTMPLGVFPPWQDGRNNDSIQRGLEFTIPQVDNLADFHGNPGTARLVLYVAGNYYFAMAPLVHAFERMHPQYKGRLYWETIPPGLLQTQMQAGGTITVGNMTWTAPPDVYMAGLGRVKKMVRDGALDAPVVPFVTNDLTIMVPKGNPAHIRSLADLARADIKLAMPNPAFEGIGKRIEKALVKAGGPALLKAVYTDKVKAGSTELTHIHHRQTPLWMMQGRVQGGVTWQSEARFQEMVGHPITHVDIPDAHNVTAIYAGAVVHGAPHAEAARQWLAFIHSSQALGIFKRYGFKAYDEGAR